MDYKRDLKDVVNLTVSPNSPLKSGQKLIYSQWELFLLPHGYQERLTTVRLFADNYAEVWLKVSIGGGRAKLYARHHEGLLWLKNNLPSLHKLSFQTLKKVVFVINDEDKAILEREIISQSLPLDVLGIAHLEFEMGDKKFVTYALSVRLL